MRYVSCNLCHYWWQYVCMMCCTPSTLSSVIFHSTQCYLMSGGVTKTIISTGLYQRPLLTFLSVETSSWTWEFLDFNLPVVLISHSSKSRLVEDCVRHDVQTELRVRLQNTDVTHHSPASLLLPSFYSVEMKLPQDQVLISSLSLSAAPLGQAV